MQRTIFHLPGLAAARDRLDSDFVEIVAGPFGMDSSSPRPPDQNVSRSLRQKTTTAYSIFYGETVGASSTCRS